MQLPSPGRASAQTSHRSLVSWRLGTCDLGVSSAPPRRRPPRQRAFISRLPEKPPHPNIGANRQRYDERRRKGGIIPKFMYVGSYTQEGAKGFAKKGGTARREAVAKMAESMGGKLDALYFAFGEDDFTSSSIFPTLQQRPRFPSKRVRPAR